MRLCLNSQWWPERQILTASLRLASSSPYEGQPGPPHWPPLPGGTSTGWAPILLASPTWVRCWIWEPEEQHGTAWSTQAESKAAQYGPLIVTTTLPKGQEYEHRSNMEPILPPEHDISKKTRPSASWFACFYFLLIERLIVMVLFSWLDIKGLGMKGIDSSSIHFWRGWSYLFGRKGWKV